MKYLLKGAPNARDLGGIKADGGVVAEKRIIRSGVINLISDEDVAALKALGLGTVIDFRTDEERQQKKDRVIDGVEYVHCPIIEMKTDGISRDKPETEDEEAVRTVAMAKRLMKKHPDGKVQMRSLYPILAGTEHCIAHYRIFFEKLLKQERGAVLYHCTMGKDRVGVGTALLLTALGVHRDDIIEDYMQTNERCAEGTRRLIESCRRYTDNEAELEFIYELDRVDESFIAAAFTAAEEKCGSMDAYLKNAMGLSPNSLERLKKLYLV